eukprot:1127381-Amphidinium_carterae.1
MAYFTGWLDDQAREYLEQQPAPEEQSVEMDHTSEDEAMASTDEEVLFANEEEDRELRASFAAASKEKEVEVGTRGGPSAHVPTVQEEVGTPSELREAGAQGGPSAGAPAQSADSNSVAEVPTILKRNEDYVREITQEAFKFIKKQEEVLSEWSEALKSLDEDSEAH